jgi:hypothetical protein
LNSDFKVEMSLSEVMPLLRAAGPGRAAGAADVHATSSTATAAAAIPHASRVLSRSRLATRIVIDLLARQTWTLIGIRRSGATQILTTST